MPVRDEVLDELESNLLIIYSGVERAARVVLSEQGKRIRTSTDDAVERMHRIKEIGHEVHRLLVEGNVDATASCSTSTGRNKRKLASKMTDSVIDEHYEAARTAGAHRRQAHGRGRRRLLHVLRRARPTGARVFEAHGGARPPPAALPLRRRRRAHRRQPPPLVSAKRAPRKNE